jgi:hypothetical protein
LLPRTFWMKLVPDFIEPMWRTTRSATPDTLPCRVRHRRSRPRSAGSAVLPEPTLSSRTPPTQGQGRRTSTRAMLWSVTRLSSGGRVYSKLL